MSDIVLEMKNIGKTFSGVNVLRGIDMTVHRGSVHCIMGENGAGKSTLIKILSGYHQPDKGGEILVNGLPVDFKVPKDAINAQIVTIYQELTLCPLMTVADNICLNIQDRFKGVLQRKKECITIASEILERIGHPEIDPQSKAGELSIAQKQFVEIAKALVCDVKVLLMDEPTSSIAKQDVESLFVLIKELCKQGVAVIYISHKIPEVIELADRVTVLRDGNLVGNLERDEIKSNKIISLMVGRNITNAYPKEKVQLGNEILKVDGVSTRFFSDVSFTVRKGEIFGITGLVGSRRTEILDAIFGRLPLTAGSIEINGVPYLPKNPRHAIKNKIAYITEDRRISGLVLCRPVEENLNLICIQKPHILGTVDRKEFKENAERQKQDMDIRLNRIKQLTLTLSGGNQQKVVFGKWMTLDPVILLFDEPTRGIDIKAKASIYELIGRMVRAGKAVVIVSNELPELLNVSDRILVMYEGKQKAILQTNNTNQEEIMKYACSGEA